MEIIDYAPYARRTVVGVQDLPHYYYVWLIDGNDWCFLCQSAECRHVQAARHFHDAFHEEYQEYCRELEAVA